MRGTELSSHCPAPPTARSREHLLSSNSHFRRGKKQGRKERGRMRIFLKETRFLKGETQENPIPFLKSSWMCAGSYVCHSTCLPSTHGGQRTRLGVGSQLPSGWPQELLVAVLHARLPGSRPEDLLVFSPCHRTTGSYTQNHWVTHSETLGHTLSLAFTRIPES